MSYSAIDAAVKAITTVSDAAVADPTLRIPVYGSEFVDILNGIKAFRDYFYAKQSTYGIPFDKLLALDSLIMLFPSPKFQDPDFSKDQNNMVECLKIISDLLPYLEVDYYTYGYYMSPTLDKRYLSYYNGYWNQFLNGYWGWGDAGLAIDFHTLAVDGYTMGTAEYWFKVNKHWDTAKVRLKAYVRSGIVGQNFMSVLFLTHGTPYDPKGAFDPRLTVLDRGDVTIAARVDLPHVAYKYQYDEQLTCYPFADITYMVMVLQDKSSTHEVWFNPQKLSVTA